LLSYYLRLGDDQGIRHCLEVLRQHPDLPAAQGDALAAQTYQQLGQRAEAEAAYLTATEQAPDDTDLHVRFAVFLHPFDPARAEVLVRRALQRAPDHPGARRVLASWLHGRDNPDAQREARELLQSGESTWAQQASDRRLEAMLLIRRGRPNDVEAARTLLEQLVTDQRYANPDDRLLLSRLHERTGNVAAAEQQLQRLVSGERPNARHLAAYVDFLLRRQRDAEAQRYLEMLERQAPMSLSAVSLRSRLLASAGQSEQIDAYLESFARHRLDELSDGQQRRQLMQQVAELFASVNRLEGAERWYERLAAEFPDARDALADFWAKTDKLPQAVDLAWQQLQAEMSPAAAALYVRMLVQSPAGTAISPEAESVVREVLQQYPDDATLLFAVASLRLKQQEVDEALGLLRHLTKTHPEHITAWNNLAAILAETPAHFDEALQCIDRAIQAAGQPMANLLDTRAVILLQQGRNQEAVELLRQVLALPDGGDPRFHFHLAVAQQRLGEAQQARVAWRRAQELGLHQTYLTSYERQLAADLGKSLAISANGS
jgi:tetratricopeptide (TPR) repeat protein